MKVTRTLLAILLLGVVTYWAPVVTQAKGLPIVKDLRVEAKISRDINAPILVFFMSKHCTYCETVLQDFLLPMYQDPAYNKKVILRQVEINSGEKLIDFNGVSTTQRELAKKYRTSAVPTLILFDSRGQELTRIVGLLTVDFYLALLDEAIDESIAKIKISASQ